MEGLEFVRRKTLQTAVAALCVEVGFVSADKESMGILSEMLQSYITELGRTSRMYSELSQRTEPTLSDVHQALIDAESKNYQQTPPKCLQVGTKVQRPSHIPAHLPAFPDPHTYIKTPTFSSPSSDYKVVREKLAIQKKHSRKGLSTLLAKIRTSRPVTGTSDPYEIYTVVKNIPTDGPLYLQTLMPTPEDSIDTIAERGSNATTGTESATEELKDESKDEDKMDTSLPEVDETLDSSMEMYENPFLKLTQKGRTSKPA